MRNYMKIYFTLILVAVVTSSCLQSFDDIKPTNKVSSEDVWKDPDAVSGILAHMYNSLIFEDFSYFWGDYSWRSMDLVTMSDEGTAGFQKEPCFDQEGATWEYPDDFLGYYIYIQGNQGGENIIRDVYRESYVLIRRCNEFLEDLKTATLESDDLDSVKGEAKFLRAMAYFTLVKRFGGVPLITEAKPFEGDIVSLQEPRATEKAIWDFIINEAEEASQLLPLIRSTGVFRATSGASTSIWVTVGLSTRFLTILYIFPSISEGRLPAVPEPPFIRRAVRADRGAFNRTPVPFRAPRAQKQAYLNSLPFRFQYSKQKTQRKNSMPRTGFKSSQPIDNGRRVCHDGAADNSPRRKNAGNGGRSEWMSFILPAGASGERSAFLTSSTA